MVTEHFTAKDEFGNLYQVVSRRRVIHDGPPPIFSIPEFRLTDGKALTPVRDRVFRIVQTGIEVTLL